MKDLWIDWLQEKQRHFFYGVFIVVAVFFISFQIYQKFQKPVATNYHAANLIFEKWVLDNKDFAELEKALASHPDLESKFGALIADKFIVSNRGDQAKPFAEKVFERVLRQTPEHTAFAEGSLLISEGKLSDALTHSLVLSSRLDTSSLLYGFNLLRLASLYRALGDRAEELASLAQLELFLKSNPKAGAILERCFSDGQHSLSDYLIHRSSQ
ncbi:MAG: hypothetical protein JSS30_00305 [Verrucomicrobia bacterium]|nr:hypothetical protein [Verrucomicrobiota bacterium]